MGHSEAQPVLLAIRPERAVDAATRQIRSAILSGQFAAGTWLPSERSLAATLGINRLTLRAAIAGLQLEGLVEPQHGRGVRVCDYRATAGLDVICHLTSGRHPGLIADLLELRRFVGAEAVALACERATTEEIERLEVLAREQWEEQDPEVFADRDLRFVREVVHAAKNLAMELLLNTVQSAYRAHPRLITAMYKDREAVRMSYLAIIGLVRAGDGEAARTAIRTALEALDRKTLALYGGD